ncbi:hypothetical protein CEP52_004024 [Fusarium oligoseptatum]|uniref:Uncharacterized protein n=1 Tax=Fusarium oligoseptatum TaxID=2604345 RepID=A0A428U5U8_9HYPO|nr:hypothetical protein CEP52_004024 [Fusarium oligoseptatum]
MSSQAVSPNTTSGTSGEGDTASSMLSKFIYDTSPLADRLIQRAMAATTTTPSTKDEPSTNIEVKDIEKSREAMAKL